MFYIDLTPGDIFLSNYNTKRNQQVIVNLNEGTELSMKVNSYKNGWDILTADGQCVGALSFESFPKSYLRKDNLNSKQVKQLLKAYIVT